MTKEICHFVIFSILIISAIGWMPCTALEAEEPALWTYGLGMDILSTSISSDGMYSAVGSRDDHLYFFDETGQVVWNYRTGGNIDVVAVSADGKYVAAGGEDKYIYLFDRSGHLLWRSKLEDDITTIAFSENSEDFGISSLDKSISFYNVLHEELWQISMKDEILSIDIDGSGDFILTGGKDNRVSAFNKTGILLWTFETGSRINAVSTSDVGGRSVAGGDDRFVYVFDKYGQILWSYYTGNIILDVACSPDGKTFAAGNANKTIFLFADDSTLIWEFTLESDIDMVDFVANGTYITANDQGNVYFFNHAGDLLTKLEVGRGLHTSAFSKDGNRVIVGSYDMNVYLFDTSSLLQVNSVPVDTPSDSSGSIFDFLPSFGVFVLVMAGIIAAGACIFVIGFSSTFKRRSAKKMLDREHPKKASKAESEQFAIKEEKSEISGKQRDFAVPKEVDSDKDPEMVGKEGKYMRVEAEKLTPLSPSKDEHDIITAEFQETGSTYDMNQELVEHWYNEGLKFSREGRYQNAIDAYERALESDPEDADSWYNRGCALDSMGHYEEAIQSYERALAIDPNDADAWNNKGTALMEIERNEEAVKSFDTVISINPRLAVAWNNKGSALLGLGRVEEALECVDKALELDPDNETYRAQRYLIMQ